MAVMRFRRFPKVGVLKEIGRELLDRFFGRVNRGGNGTTLELPPASASDEEYFARGGAARALMSPEGLPEEVGEAPYMVDETVSEAGGSSKSEGRIPTSKAGSRTAVWEDST